MEQGSPEWAMGRYSRVYSLVSIRRRTKKRTNLKRLNAIMIRGVGSGALAQRRNVSLVSTGSRKKKERRFL